MGNAGRDQNYVPTLLAVSNADGQTPVTLYADPTTHRLLVSIALALDNLTDVVITTVAQGDVLYYDGSNWVNLPAGTSGQFLKTQGAGANPVWASVSATAPFADNAALVKNSADNTKLVIFSAASITTGTTRTITVPDVTGTMALTSNKLSAFAATSSAELAGVISDETGSGLLVFGTSPVLTTPNIGVATATSINKMAVTAPATSSTLAVVDGKTFTVNNTITLAAGADSQTFTLPSTSATIARTDAGQTFTGVNVFTSPKIVTDIDDTNGNHMIAFTATGSAVNYVKLTNAATGTAGPIISAEGETNVDLKITGKGTGKVHHTSGVYGDITAYSPAGGATATLTLNTSNIHTITMPAGNITIALSNEGVGQCFVINIIQDGTGSRTVTWFTTIKWAGGSAPTLTTTASKIDTFGFIVASAGNYYGYVVGQNL